MYVLYLLSSPYCFPSYFWESSRTVLSCYPSTPSLLTKGQLPINELNKCSLGTMYQALAQLLGPWQRDISFLKRDRQDPVLEGTSGCGNMEGPGWRWAWIPGHSQLQFRKGPWTMPPSLQEALAEATNGSPQKGRNAPSLSCDTLCHLDPETTLRLPYEARWRRGPSASSCSNTPSSEPSPPCLTLYNSVPLPREPVPSYPTRWLLHPTHRALSFSSD